MAVRMLKIPSLSSRGVHSRAKAGNGVQYTCGLSIRFARAASFLAHCRLMGLILLLCVPPCGISQEHRPADPWAVEAAFLRNFTHYVNWPATSFATPESPWKICILGKDPFGKTLERSFGGRTEQGRSFTILRSENPAELQLCHIVYVAYQVSASRRAALTRLLNRPVLTVSNAHGFLQEGGMIRFEVLDTIGLHVNLDQAKAASLSIQTKVLEICDSIIDNGKLKRLR